MSSIRKYKLSIRALLVFIIQQLLTACGGGAADTGYSNHTSSIEREDSQASMFSGIENTVNHQQVIEGRSLYIDHCASCHGNVDQSEKRGSTKEQISTSMAKVPAMQDVALTQNDMILITIALNYSLRDFENSNFEESSDDTVETEFFDQFFSALGEVEQANSNVQKVMQRPDLNCTNSSCHDATPGSARVNLLTGSLESLAERLVNVPSSSQACRDELLIDSGNPRNSLLYKLIDAGSGEQCMSKMPFGAAGIPNSYLPVFERWIEDIIAVSTQHQNADDVQNEASTYMVASDPFILGSRLKYLVNGVGLTDDELMRMTFQDGSLNRAGLSEVIDKWLASPLYATKLSQFLKVALQQKTTDGRFTTQLNGLSPTSKLKRNIEESFTRTAVRIALSDSSFKEVVTTRDWELSTVALAALAYADHPKRPQNADSTFLDTPFIDSDYNDWRTVSLRTVIESPYQDAQAFKNISFVESLRNVAEGGTLFLKTPRVGFFTTPVFFDQWQTNADNQFRLNTNQTLITALGLTFSSGDPTLPNQIHLDDLDQDHAPAGSDCHGCHKNLDPMKNIFMNHFSPVTFRAKEEQGVLRDYFSFQGQRSELSSMIDFAHEVADHPHFAKGWTLRLCQWLSSTSCSDQEDSIESFSTQFAASGYQFKTLMKALLMSDILLNTSYDAGSDHPGAYVSIARKDHFCEAINARLRVIREERNLPLDNVLSMDMCNHPSLRKIAQTFPNDDFARGKIDLVQSSRNDLFLSSAFGQFCDASARRVVGQKSVHTFKTNQVDYALDDMTEYMLGIPQSAPSYQQSRDSLQRLYDVARHDSQCRDEQALAGSISSSEVSCGLGLNAVDSLRLVWINSCQSPHLTGIGL